MSQEQFQNELDYHWSVKLLRKMLEEGLITQEEYTKIDKLNRLSFTPSLAPSCPDFLAITGFQR